MINAKPWMNVKGVMPVIGASLKRLCTLKFHLGDILENLKLKGWRADRWLAEVGWGKGLTTKGQPCFLLCFL